MAELQNVSGIFGGRKSLPAVSHVSINCICIQISKSQILTLQSRILNVKT